MRPRRDPFAVIRSSAPTSAALRSVEPESSVDLAGVFLHVADAAPSRALALALHDLAVSKAAIPPSGGE
jgi:hypothetical protein